MEALEARRRLDDARNAFALAADKNAALSRAALSPLLRELGDVAPAVDHFGSNYFGDKLRGRSDAMNVALAWPEFDALGRDGGQGASRDACRNDAKRFVHAARCPRWPVCCVE